MLIIMLIIVIIVIIVVVIVLIFIVTIPMGKEGALCRHNGSLRSISTITMIYHNIQPRLHLHNVHFISSTYISNLESCVGLRE